jgi:hypothetical protein
MVQAALTVVPSVISAVSSLATIRGAHIASLFAEGGALSAVTIAHTAHAVAAHISAAAHAVLNAVMNANPIMIVVIAIAALVAGLIWAYQNCEPFRNAVNAIANVLTGAFGAAIAAVRGALEWLWNNVLVPLGKFLGGALLTAWNALADGISYVYNNILKPVFDALKAVWDYVIKPIADTIGAIVGAVSGFLGIGGGAPSNQNLGVGGRLQTGGVVMRPTVALLGEAGPEAIIPLNKITQVIPIREMGNAGGVMIEINAPLVSIAGSADRQTAELAARLVQDRLRNVLVEASSSSAGLTHKRIRMGT